MKIELLTITCKPLQAAELLQTTLDEEKAADVKLTEVAVSAVNVEATT